MHSSIKAIGRSFIIFFVVLNVHAYGQIFKPTGTFTTSNSKITCLALGDEGKYIITGDESGDVTFRDAESGKLTNIFHPFTTPVDNINFNSNGKLMIITTRDGQIKIYDFQQEKFIQSLYSPDYTDMRFALFSIADGFIYFNGQGRLYKTRSDLSQPVEKIYECDLTITNAVITEDRSALIFSCGNSLKVLNTRTDNITQEITTSPATIERLAWSSGNRLASWSNDGTIVIRKYELNQLHNDLLIWFKAGTCSKLAFSHDGNMMVTGLVGNWARVWKPFDRTVLQELFGHKDDVTNFVFSDDDQTLYTASNDHTIKVWKQNAEERKIDPQKDSVKKEVVSVPIVKKDTLSSITNPGLSDSSMPLIEMNQSNVPFNVGGRKLDKTTTVEVDQQDLDIYVFDNSTIDGDIMSLAFRNQWIIQHYEVQKKKRKITVHLEQGSNNYLVLFADNLGRTPPNTAAISFKQKGRERVFRLESNLQTCSAINFIYKGK